MPTIAVTLITLLAQYGPDVYKAAVDILHSTEPTKEDYARLHSLVQSALKNANEAVEIANA
jgi:hypothetical protein